MFKRSWKLFSKIGLQNDTGTSVAKRIKLTNQLALISTLLTLFYIPIFIYWGFSNVVVFQLIALCVYPASILLSVVSYNLLSRYIYIIGLFLHMFVLCLFFGEASQMHLLFIPVTATPLILFDLKQLKIIISLVVIAILLYSSLYFLHFTSPMIEIPDSLITTMRLWFNVTAILGEVAVIGSFVYNFEHSAKILNHNNLLLQEQLQAIFENSYDALFLVDWKKRKIIKVNQRAVEMFGMQGEREFYDSYGIDLHKTLPTEAEMLHMRKTLAEKGMYEAEVLYKTKQNTEFWGALAIKLVSIGSQQYQSVRVTDITVEKKAKEHIEASLLEKEILLSEIHHRVKNNMAVISGLLGLQSGYVEDEKSKLVFEESRNRIHSMALIHDKLYQHETFARIDFNSYCSDLINYIRSSYNSSHAKVNFTLNCHDVYIDIKNAVPCGLILNELVSNAYKHAFKGRDEGEIRITCTKMGEKVTMMVSDNGIGFDAENTLREPVSLGLTLISALINQINGSVKTVNKNGMSYYISFEE
ncbi:MAG: two-component hybrid sensor and regulator [Bacteroidota bacterium]|jgi:PAS domain S-box-containing protein|nr:two-component hybrid sensor and regulator [Bacteroidota bacterium]